MCTTQAIQLKADRRVELVCADGHFASQLSKNFHASIVELLFSSVCLLIHELISL